MYMELKFHNSHLIMIANTSLVLILCHSLPESIFGVLVHLILTVTLKGRQLSLVCKEKMKPWEVKQLAPNLRLLMGEGRKRETGELEPTCRLSCCLVTRLGPALLPPLVACNPRGSSVHGPSQARILEWVAMSFSRGSSQPSDRIQFSCISRRILYH